ncbi:efflux RND transporter periplasmic adaptor subunit [Roseiconus lacunae]|uniref:efflux RND transporter periplasmic adaptor subunit n=1 Tax=Roseiconus lacunae TaxID=2605694 RepID=UPI0011F1013C|nr:efflux RND transporter periplasmic adaptor subunit [Roseiconus lacunae]
MNEDQIQDTSTKTIPTSGPKYDRGWIRNVRWTALIVLIAVIGTSVVTGVPRWNRWPLAGRQPAADSESSAVGDEDHGHVEHDHPRHDDQQSIELSEQARANLRLQTQIVSLQTFKETIEIPAVITAWPGQTHVAMTSPLTGVINSIQVSRGEVVRSGTPLFTLRLTHQDLVETQEDFLTSLGQLDVEQREIQRLTSIASSGAIAASKRIEREYERDRLEASLRAARQSMLLHGLTAEQIKGIETTRELVREVTVYAPVLHSDRSLHHEAGESYFQSSAKAGRANPGEIALPGAQVLNTKLTAFTQPLPHPEHIDAEFLVTDLNVTRGQSVQAGQMLAQLSDYSELLIEGSAFQRDSETLRSIADRQEPLQAIIELDREQRRLVEGLKIVYLGNEVNRQSRALPFYVRLKNEVERTVQSRGHQFVSWRYKPGQRLTLRIPTKSFDQAIVVPKEAVAEEGPERYVFVENAKHFDRVGVHVLASDSVSVAIANDGQLWPGQTIATRGAHQLQMAIKNKTVGAIDPHAGHNH